MTPAARVQAALDLLTAIDEGGRPADRHMADYLRRRRYIGSKDRRAITALVYDVLRRQARIGWWLAREAPAEPSTRRRIIGYLALTLGARETLEIFDGGTRYGPTALTDGEAAIVERLSDRGCDHPEQPLAARCEWPDWLLPYLGEADEAAIEATLTVLNEPAALDLRVNSLKASRDEARRRLAEEGLEAAPTPLSPLGLRVSGRLQLPALPAFRDGLIEVQDEGAQIVALLCDARPGVAVADLCAGAGGKTLALAAAMANEGRLVALDIDEARLARGRPRYKRAGAASIEPHVLTGDDDPWLGDNAAGFNRVLVDAPCSGSGAWRRQPEARWRLTAAVLDGHLDRQRQVLALGAGLLRPGGRLIYATCSLLPCENEEQAAWFEAGYPDFEAVPIDEVWDTVGLSGACPSDGPYLQLTPAQQGTDGFFVAIWQRR